MELHASGEDYLEAIMLLKQKNGEVRSVDLARHMGFSKASISRAVALLRDGGFVRMEEDGDLDLTEIGLEVAKKIYERHCFFRQQLLDAGVAPEIAEDEACRMEHILSEESFEKLKDSLNGEQHK